MGTGLKDSRTGKYVKRAKLANWQIHYQRTHGNNWRRIHGKPMLRKVQVDMLIEEFALKFHRYLCDKNRRSNIKRVK